MIYKKNIVSVVIITYNSSKFIIETLESVRKQTYKNIELIISDDSSNDDTLKLCEEWKKNFEDYFYRVLILKSKKNEGLVKNLNKGVKLATAEWVKVLAGDDILEDKCIENNLRYVEGNPEIKIVFSKTQRFKNEFLKENYLEIPSDKEDKIFFEKKARNQFKILAMENVCSAPTSFIKNELYSEYGYYDETYPMVEDYPMWLKLTKNGVKLNFLNIITVFYRIHSESISSSKKEKKINIEMYEFRKKLYYNFLKKEMNSKIFDYCENLDYYKNDRYIRKGNKKYRRDLWEQITLLVDPRYYKRKLKKLKNLMRGANHEKI